MIVIFTQDETFIRENADAAKNILETLYGEKLGREAYRAVYKAPAGTAYRKNGGPLVQVVTKEKATEIWKKEVAVGMVKGLSDNCI